MTHTERKQLAQERLLFGIQTAFEDDSVFDGVDEHGRTLPLNNDMRLEMDNQMRRVEKLFGF